MHSRIFLAVGLIATSGLTLANNEIKAVKVSGASHPSLAGELPTGTLTLDRETLASMPASNLTEVLDTVGGCRPASSMASTAVRPAWICWASAPAPTRTP